VLRVPALEEDCAHERSGVDRSGCAFLEAGDRLRGILAMRRRRCAGFTGEPLYSKLRTGDAQRLPL
jgi:hypothetical protein